MAKKPILEALAQELGYKDAKALKKKMTEGHGDDFAGSVKSRLEEGAGFGEAFKGGFSDAKKGLEKKLDPKNIKKELVKGAFGGDDILSAYMRGKFRDKSEDKKEEDKNSPSAEGSTEGGSFTELNSFLKIIAKNSMSLHLMARDMNVLRQNIVKLVKLEAKDYNKGKSKRDQIEARTGADTYFLRADEAETKLEVDRQKYAPKPVAKEGEKKDPEKESGILDTILGFFKNGLLAGIMSIFNPANLLKVLGKVFLITAIFAGLFQGITAAFDKWKETGSLKDAIIAGLGGVLDFLTFGLFGEDSVKKMFDAVQGFVTPIIQSIADVITSMKDWVANNIGIPKVSLGTWFGKERSIGPYYPFKNNPTSEEPQTSTAPQIGDVKTVSAPPAPGAPEATQQIDASGLSKTASELERQITGDNGTVIKSETQIGTSPQLQLPSNPEEAKKVLIEQASKVLGMPLPDPTKPTPEGSSGNPQLDETIISKVESIIKQKGLSAPPSGGGSVESAPSGGGSSGNLSAPSGGSSPSAESDSPASSGAALSTASADVAEMQRMESAADMGGSVNSQTITNNSNSSGKEPTPQIADVYDTEFAKLIAA
jgi:hypothetical protein